MQRRAEMRKKALLTTLLASSMIVSCATKMQEKENEKIISQIKQEAQNSKQVKEENLLDIQLVEKVPISVVIEKSCLHYGYTCNVSKIKSVGRFTFKGTFSEFLSLLEKEYNITYTKYGESYFFSQRENNIDEDKLLQKVSVNVSSTPFEYFLSILSDEAGIPIVLEDVSFADTNTTTSSPMATPMPSSSQATTMSVKSTRIGNISYYSTNKSVKQILDEVCSMYDLTWRIENDKVVISKYKTATFRIALPFLEKQVDLKDDAYTLSYKKQFYNNIEKNIQGVLQDKNSKATVSDTGYVMVYARPSEVRLVQRFVEKINEDYSKVIPLRLTIAIIQLNDKYTAGMNLLDLADLKKTNRTTHIDNKLDMTNKAFTIGITGKSINAIFSAFGEYGNVRILENSEYRVLNGQPLVWKPMTKQRILSNIQLNYVPVSSGGQGSVATTTQPTITTQTEDIQEGSNLLVVPYMIDRDKIVVDLYRNNTQIQALNQYQINLQGVSNNIILPTIKSDSQIQQTVLTKGEKAILVSNVLDKDNLSTSGIPFLKDIQGLGLLFGQQTKEKNKYQVVVVVSYEGE